METFGNAPVDLYCTFLEILSRHVDVNYRDVSSTIAMIHLTRLSAW